MDPSMPGRWVFIGQTNDQKGVLLEGWASKNGSDFSQGFTSLGNFFPATHDSRCSIPTGCGYFTPSFANGVTIRGFHLLWGGNNQYWLGNYTFGGSLNASRMSGSQQFVPATVVQSLDGPESSCAKGFFDAKSQRYVPLPITCPTNLFIVQNASNSMLLRCRYLLWLWVSPAGDGKYVSPHFGWDSMISLPRVVDVDPDLLQMTLYPVKELELLRFSPPLVQKNAMPLPEGVTPLEVTSNTMDLEVTFDFSKTKTGTIPTTPNVVFGVAVLVGRTEQTLVTYTCGTSTRFNNATRKNAPGAVHVFVLSTAHHNTCHSFGDRH
jgi:hypothetical protein